MSLRHPLLCLALIGCVEPNALPITDLGARAAATVPYTTYGYVDDVNGDGFDDYLTADGIFGGDVDFGGTERLASFPEDSPQLGDFNGDGLLDLLNIDDQRSVDFLNEGQVSIRYATEHLVWPSEPDLILLGGSIRAQIGSEFVIGDFNGDGIDDIVLSALEWEQEGQIVKAVFAHYGSPTGLSAQPDWSIIGASEGLGGAVVLRAGDLNGDGNDELGLAREAGTTAFPTYVIEFFRGGDTGLEQTPAIHYIQLTEDKELFLDMSGDFNGDGLADVLLRAHDFTYGLEGSDGPEILVYHQLPIAGIVAFATDIDGDGYDDMVRTIEPGLILFGGPDLTTETARITQYTLPERVGNLRAIKDLNGDGFPEFVAYKLVGTNHILSLFAGTATGPLHFAPDAFGTSSSATPFFLDIDADGLPDQEVYPDIRLGSGHILRSNNIYMSTFTVLGDRDLDGNIEYLYRRRSDFAIRLWEPGSSAVSEPTDSSYVTVHASGIGDIDGDGRIDGADDSGFVLGTADGWSQPTLSYSGFPIPYSDFDGDGQLDLVVAGVGVWFGGSVPGSQQPDLDLSEVRGEEPWPVHSAVDMDQDGRTDLIFAVNGPNDGRPGFIRVLFGNDQGSTTPQDIPVLSVESWSDRHYFIDVLGDAAPE